MSDHNAPLAAIPTNIITGFLGVGKTSTILHLLKHKPVNERWAVLVNEFGEIGVDGSLVEGQHTEQQGVFIKEVPGGCMCCTSGLPMQIALNQLLMKAKPDRLLIEPTGLGHPKEVLQTLADSHYQDVLAIQKTITLVDARKLSEPRYAEHDTFIQQVAIADCVVGNKSDQYSQQDQQLLDDFVTANNESASVLRSNFGQIPVEILQGESSFLGASSGHHHHHHHDKPAPLVAELEIPECGYLRANNSGDGYNSVGWRFSPVKVFSYKKLSLLLGGISAERMKAVFITEEGVFGYNLVDDTLTEMYLEECDESRIEVIAEALDPDLESKLVECLLDA